MAYVEHGDLDVPFSEFLRTVCRKVLVLSKTTDMLLGAFKDLRIEAKASRNGPESPALWYLELEDYYGSNFGDSYEKIASRLECLISWLIQDAHILDMGVMSPTKQTRLIKLFVKVNKDMQRPLRRRLPVTSRERHEMDQAITTAIDLVPARSSTGTTDLFSSMDYSEPSEPRVETKNGPSLFELWNWYLQTGLGAFTVITSMVTAVILIVGAKADMGTAFQVASWVLAAGTLIAVTVKICLSKRPKRREVRGTP